MGDNNPLGSFFEKAADVANEAGKKAEKFTSEASKIASKTVDKAQVIANEASKEAGKLFENASKTSDESPNNDKKKEKELQTETTKTTENNNSKLSKNLVKSKINDKNKKFIIIGIVIAVVVCISVIYFINSRSHDSQPKSNEQTISNYENESLIWPTDGLATLLPKPVSSYGHVVTNSSNSFVCLVARTDNNAFDSYITQCKEKSFTVEQSSYSNNYDAKDNSGNKLHLFINTTTKEMRISLDKQNNNNNNNNNNTDQNSTLTTANCPELVAVLSCKDPNDPIIGDFAAKYKGRKIEFDGNVAEVSHNKDYKTRWNILIHSGNYDPNTAIGPDFQFYDVYNIGSFSDDDLREKDNIHVIAEVDEYVPSTGLFKLKPVKITHRK